LESRNLQRWHRPWVTRSLRCSSVSIVLLIEVLVLVLHLLYNDLFWTVLLLNISLQLKTPKYSLSFFRLSVSATARTQNTYLSISFLYFLLITSHTIASFSFLFISPVSHSDTFYLSTDYKIIFISCFLLLFINYMPMTSVYFITLFFFILSSLCQRQFYNRSIQSII
jgi:hypothetical protein